MNNTFYVSNQHLNAHNNHTKFENLSQIEFWIGAHAQTQNKRKLVNYRRAQSPSEKQRPHKPNKQESLSVAEDVTVLFLKIPKKKRAPSNNDRSALYHAELSDNISKRNNKRDTIVYLRVPLALCVADQKAVLSGLGSEKLEILLPLGVIIVSAGAYSKIAIGIEL